MEKRLWQEVYVQKPDQSRWIGNVGTKFGGQYGSIKFEWLLFPPALLCPVSVLDMKHLTPLLPALQTFGLILMRLAAISVCKRPKLLVLATWASCVVIGAGTSNFVHYNCNNVWWVLDDVQWRLKKQDSMWIKDACVHRTAFMAQDQDYIQLPAFAWVHMAMGHCTVPNMVPVIGHLPDLSDIDLAVIAIRAYKWYWELCWICSATAAKA